MKNTTVRFTEAKDKAQVLQLLDELGREVGGEEAVESSMFEEILTRPDTMIFVAEENSSIVGLITFYLLPNIRHGWHGGYIEDFIITRSKRGQGIGSSLMQAVKEYCRKSGIKVVKVNSGNRLKQAHRFYERHGGKQTEIMFRFDIHV